jgi:hypothetical protein
MAGVKGRSGTNRGQDKAFADAVRRACYAEDYKRLNQMADRLTLKAAAGDLAAISQVADRLDGKPKQESEVHHTRDVSVWTDQEILERIAEIRARAAGDAPEAPLNPSQLN